MTSTAKRLHNLDRAREATTKRTEFKRELKAGDASLSTILREGIPDWLGTMSAERLLCLAPRVGVHACVSLLAEANLGPTQEARHITTRQRLLLAEELDKIANLKRARPHRTALGSRRSRAGAA